MKLLFVLAYIFTLIGFIGIRFFTKPTAHINPEWSDLVLAGFFLTGIIFFCATAIWWALI